MHNHHDRFQHLPSTLKYLPQTQLSIVTATFFTPDQLFPDQSDTRFLSGPDSEEVLLKSRHAPASTSEQITS